jgi:2-succinyl-5-enolpyruvyl-6-hydroxy-3-cyclohexene-1-carboxylate synthase
MSDKAREFWIEEAPFAATTKGYYQKHVAYTEEMEQPETNIHVIEYSEVEKLRKELEAANKAANGLAATNLDLEGRLVQAIEIVRYYGRGRSADLGFNPGPDKAREFLKKVGRA